MSREIPIHGGTRREPERRRWEVLRPLALLSALVLLLAPAGVAAEPAADPAPTTVLVVRHAERADDSPNSNLREEGLARARALAEVAAASEVTAIYSTDLCRTAQTVAPLARRLGLPLYLQPIDHPAAGLAGCDPPVSVPTEELRPELASPGALAQLIRTELAGATVLVAGHSNTVPVLLEALGARESVEIPEDGYGDLFIVTLDGAGGEVLLERSRFGDAAVAAATHRP